MAIKSNSSKKTDFLISSSIVIGFIVLVVLITNYMLISFFGFNQENFMIITIVLVALGVGLHIFLSKSLIEPLLHSDEQIQNLIKETLHELNTPVATIQINTQMIKRKEENTKNIIRLEKIEKSCENLLTLYSQMEYNLKKEVDNIITEDFDLKLIVQKSIANFDDIKQNITIEETIPTNKLLHTDKNGFEKVINNLISNGIKYNKNDGYIKINFLDGILSVEDSGVGIDTNNLFKVYDKYYQQNTQSQGIGLGLNIVKEFCDKNKIKINIDSISQTGTTFYLDLTKLIIH